MSYHSNLSGVKLQDQLIMDEPVLRPPQSDDDDPVIVDMSGRAILNRATRKQSSSSSYSPFCFPLLNLPMETVLDIADKMEPHGERVLSTTCKTLHNAIGHRSRSQGVPQMSRAEQVRYEVCMARSKPSSWVCERCVHTHDIRRTDDPLTPNPAEVNCPWDRDPANFPGRLHNSMGYWLYHRHVQMALKLSRLGKQRTLLQTHRLQNLMAPLRDKIARLPVWGPDSQVNFIVSQTPKIINGRYVLHSTFNCEIHAFGKAYLFDETIQKLRICPHQTWLHLQTAIRTEDLIEMYPDAFYVHSNFAQAVRWALFIPPFQDIQGSCPWCTTDYSIKLDTDEYGYKAIIVQTWQDLGGEDAPDSLPWAAVAMRDALPFGNPATSPTCEAAAGSSRELYEVAVRAERKNEASRQRRAERSQSRHMKRWRRRFGLVYKPEEPEIGVTVTGSDNSEE